MNTILSNYHEHSNYCDGKGKMQDYVKEALNLGMKSMGFSSYVPLPFECRMVHAKRTLGKLYKGSKRSKEEI